MEVEISRFYDGKDKETGALLIHNPDKEITPKEKDNLVNKLYQYASNVMYHNVYHKIVTVPVSDGNVHVMVIIDYQLLKKEIITI
jgi:hypothetical protein